MLLNSILHIYLFTYRGMKVEESCVIKPLAIFLISFWLYYISSVKVFFRQFKLWITWRMTQKQPMQKLPSQSPQKNESTMASLRKEGFTPLLYIQIREETYKQGTEKIWQTKRRKTLRQWSDWYHTRHQDPKQTRLQDTNEKNREATKSPPHLLPRTK